VEEVGRHAPAALPPGKKPGSHPRGSCVGLGAGLDGSVKSHPIGFRSPDRLARSESIYNSTVPAVHNQLYLSIYSEDLYVKMTTFLVLLYKFFQTKYVKFVKYSYLLLRSG
jgi:hypothetical protein